MKVRIIDVEGSSEEMMNFPELVAALRGERAPIAEGDAKGHSLEPRVNEFHQFIRDRARGNEIATLMMDFIDEVLSWGDSTIQPGKSKKNASGHTGYLLMYPKGPRHSGAFVYVIPGRAKLTFRLLAAEAQGLKHAFVRNVVDRNQYQVTIELDSESAFKEALDLARLALKRAPRSRPSADK